MTTPEKLPHVTAVCKANIYFDGKVVSHTLLFPDGTRKTLGLIYPGTYHFDTGAPEVMEIVAGACRVLLAGDTDWQTVAAGSSFSVPGNSSFEITVEDGICEYLCSFA